MKKNYNELAMVLNYTSSVWGASKTDREVSDEIIEQKRATTKKAGRFVKHLLAGDCPELKAMTNHVQDFRSWIRSVAFPASNMVRGSVIVPNGKILEIAQECRRFQVQFGNLVQVFLDRYEEIVENAKAQLVDLAADDYPSKEAVRHKFDFKFWFSPIPESSDFANKLGITELEQMLQDQYDKQIETTFKDGEDRLREILKARLMKMHEALTNFTGNGKGSSTALNERAIEAAREEFEGVRSLNLRGSQDIRSWSSRALQIMSRQGREYRNSAPLRHQTAEEIETLLADMGHVIYHRVEERAPSTSYADLFTGYN